MGRAFPVHPYFYLRGYGCCWVHRVIWCICGSVRLEPNPCRFMGEGICSEPAEFPSYCGLNSATTLLPSFSWYGDGTTHNMGCDCHHRGLHVVQSGRMVILVITVTVGLARVRRSAQESVVLASFELGSAGIGGFPRQGSGFDVSLGYLDICSLCRAAAEAARLTW